ncbi:MAG: IscS subfamily cysteine desulfurase [Pseudomonadota bacterium]
MATGTDAGATGERGAAPHRPVYLDYQATTPIDPRVLGAMMPYFTDKFGNPHSRHHAYGWEAEDAVDQARAQVAELIGADPSEIVFTSGATESSNLAIIGVARFAKHRKNHIVTVVSEHNCVLDTCRHLEEEGVEVSYLPVEPNGILDLGLLEQAIGDHTVLVSAMAANNEIGVLQPIKEIGAICRARGVVFHTDAAQAAGKIRLDVEDMKIDLMSLSGHKIYGPKGIGALYVRRKPRVRLVALIHGGGQEHGLRSGTLPTPLCVGLGAAAAISGVEMAAEAKRLKALRDRFYEQVTRHLPAVYLNGDLERRLPGNINLSFADVGGEALMMGIKDLAVSSGSACSSATREPSYVLGALGRDAELADASLRFGFGRFTTAAEVDYAADRIVETVRKLRELDPLSPTARGGYG